MGKPLCQRPLEAFSRKVAALISLSQCYSHSIALTDDTATLKSTAPSLRSFPAGPNNWENSLIFSFTAGESNELTGDFSPVVSVLENSLS